jgi:hypothetical protein
MNLVKEDPDKQAFAFVKKYTPNQVCPEFCKIVNEKDNLCLMGKFPSLFSCLIATTYLVALTALTVFGVLPVPESVLVMAASFPAFLFAFAILYAKSNHNKTYFVLVKGKGRIEFFDLVSQSVSTASIVPESVYVESKLGRDELGDHLYIAEFV